MKRWQSAFSMLLMVIMLAGCSSGNAHLTIQMDGTADLNLTMFIKKSAQRLISGQLDLAFEKLAQLSKAEYRIHKDASGTEYKMFKHFDALDQQNLKQLLGDGQSLTTIEHFFYTRYQFKGQYDMSQLAGWLTKTTNAVGLPTSLVELAAGQLEFEFMLTMPVKLPMTHNADRVDGKTLSWDVSFTEPNVIELDVSVPNVKNIVMTAVTLLLVLSALIIYMVVRRGRIRRAAG
ncbi:hypothetical protein EBB07_24615 [Paenibacillaceae bacterium]|nr:hypothetical protein EBB07_24615 [Paenibacillaceae bacterium]